MKVGEDCRNRRFTGEEDSVVLRDYSFPSQHSTYSLIYSLTCALGKEKEGYHTEFAHI